MNQVPPEDESFPSYTVLQMLRKRRGRNQKPDGMIVGSERLGESLHDPGSLSRTRRSRDEPHFEQCSAGEDKAKEG